MMQRPRRTFRQWYRAQTRFSQIGLGCATIFLALVLCFIFAGIMGTITNAQLPETTPVAQATTTQMAIGPSNTTTQVPTQRPTPTPKLTPTATPTPKPTAIPPTPKPTPTKPPAPTPTHCVGVNNNPWCYDFNPGSLIYTPPDGFCNYFNCIPTFYGSDDPGDGYIIECQDGTYSQSGGESGACSYHGGEMRPLYSH